MYNPATQVQVPTDLNLGSYFQKIKSAIGASPTAFPFKKKRESSTTYYVHYFAHQLQLVVVAVVRRHIGIGSFLI
jgi:hypothetical protein